MQCTSGAIFFEVDAGLAEYCRALAAGTINTAQMLEWRVGRLQEDGADLLLTQCQQCLAGSVKAQCGEAGVGLVKHAIAILIQVRQFGKTVATAGAKQLVAMALARLTLPGS